MYWNFRTFLRLFLLLGGLVLLAWGIAGDAILNILVGGVAVLLGAAGLAYEWRETAEQ